MQMYPRDQGVYKEHYYEEVAEEYVYKDETNYNRHPTTHIMKPHDQFNHNYNKNHGYGPHNEHERFPVQYSGNRYEEESHADAWNKRNDYNALGGKHHIGHNGGMQHNGYGGHQGHYGPHRDQQYQQFSECSERNKKVPAWAFKSITE